MISYESYKIIIEKKAQKYLQDLSKPDHAKVASKIKSLTSSNLQSLNIKKLQGYKKLYRLRVSDYRVIFAVIPDKKIILIAVIGHRKEVYDIAKRLSF